MAVGCFDPPERTVYRGGTEYMPLLEGRKLLYRETEAGEQLEYSLTLHYLGGRQWKIFGIREEESPYGAIEFESDGKIVRATTQLSFTSLDDRSGVGAFTAVWLDQGADEDSTWLDDQAGTETIVAGFEGVTVPAGRFSECLKIVTTPLDAVADSIEARYQRNAIDEQQYVEERAVANWQTVRWFAAGVGLVREQIGPPGETKILRELLMVAEIGTGKADSALFHRNETNE